MNYSTYSLEKEIVVSRLVSFHYYELEKSFWASGEKHDFWEFVYVDKGKLDVHIDERLISLEQGDMIFYKPNAFHAGGARQETAPNIIIISFECDSEAMSFFEDRRFRLRDQERAILACIVEEGLDAFDPPIDDRQTNILFRRPGAPFGCEQLIQNYLEILLVCLIRSGYDLHSEDKPSPAGKENKDQELVRTVIAYMKTQLSANLTVDVICDKIAVSKSRLKTVFKMITGYGIMEYYNKLRIDKAKELIREEAYNYTEIAAMLGYSSIHYFSRQFKQLTDMSLTEYSRTVHARVRNREKGARENNS
ncbi:helix-turn-helix transcriptional regulator [Paenibacillus mendelii]|uniref:Helix-turn-helix domain-containing protein n=1 Tax=Paenibacillus mendelii TaxID=206163 RepID=A0ABV6J877_9BACL|nr:AraC family transcriptional regulator [Paenibacillus mendelii]MCQ6560964.1 AraC family transcriptional regulator [Paenibacillus mendelii]